MKEASSSTEIQPAPAMTEVRGSPRSGIKDLSLLLARILNRTYNSRQLLPPLCYPCCHQHFAELPPACAEIQPPYVS